MLPLTNDWPDEGKERAAAQIERSSSAASIATGQHFGTGSSSRAPGQALSKPARSAVQAQHNGANIKATYHVILSSAAARDPAHHSVKQHNIP